MLSPDNVRRRVKAARALAGYSVDELAEVVAQPGLGARTLRALEGDKGRPFRPMELRAIADACELPYEFFTEDFWALANLPTEKAASQEELDEVRDDILQIGLVLNNLVDRLGQQQPLEQVAINEGRGLTQDAVDQLERDAPDESPAAGTRDGEGASQAASRARAAGKRSNG